jgi:hypothetical protein
MFKFHTHAAAVVNIQIEVSHIFERAVRTGREAIERAWRKQLDQLFPEKDQKAFKTKRGQIEARDRAAALRYCTWSDPEVDVLAVPSTRNPSRATSRAPSAHRMQSRQCRVESRNRSRGSRASFGSPRTIRRKRLRHNRWHARQVVLAPKLSVHRT